MNHNLKHWRGLLFSLMLVGVMVTLTSCGDDEPSSTTIEYYLEVEEAFLVDGSASTASQYYSPITRMREVIRKTYPTPDARGNDDAVMAACDKEFEEYCQMYSGDPYGHITCLFNLIRAVKVGTVVKQNDKLKTYLYDINSIDGNTEN